MPAGWWSGVEFCNGGGAMRANDGVDGIFWMSEMT